MQKLDKLMFAPNQNIEFEFGGMPGPQTLNYRNDAEPIPVLEENPVQEASSSSVDEPSSDWGMFRSPQGTITPITTFHSGEPSSGVSFIAGGDGEWECVDDTWYRL
jgi:hypothetical protein